MIAKVHEDPRLTKLSEICNMLPEVVRTVYGDHTDFRVQKKPFAYFLNNHHGDHIVSVCCNTAQGDNIDRVNNNPEMYYLPKYIGKQGWFGLRLDRGGVDWDEVENVIINSYCLAAPKKLVSLVQKR